MRERENQKWEGTPDIFNIGIDLKYYHQDQRPFTRKDALMVIIIKCQVLKDFKLIMQYIESVVRDQGERWFLINTEDPTFGLEELFSELKNLALKIPDYEISEFMEWKVAFVNALRNLQYSVYFLKTGHYRLYNRSKEYDVFLQDILSILQGKNKQEPEKPIVKLKLLKITEAAKILNCSRDMIYKVHIKKGLKTVKPASESHQKIIENDLMEYIKKLNKN